MTLALLKAFVAILFLSLLAACACARSSDFRLRPEDGPDTKQKFDKKREP